MELAEKNQPVKFLVDQKKFKYSFFSFWGWGYIDFLNHRISNRDIRDWEPIRATCEKVYKIFKNG